MSEVATYLKVGTTAIVLAMIEDDALGEDLAPRQSRGGPPAGVHDPTLSTTIMLRDGSRATALEIQWGLLERARKYEQSQASTCRRGRSVRRARPWETVLTGLESDPASVANGSTGSPNSGCSTATPRAPRIEWGSSKLGDRSAVPRPARRPVPRAAGRPRHAWSPRRGRRGRDRTAGTTRAYFRGRCLQKFPDDIVAANWDSLVFDIGATRFAGCR
jgi:Pup amidohydrolase